MFLLASATSASERFNAAGVTAYQDSELGAHLDITLTPIFRPALMNADWERDRYLWMRVGYARLGALRDSPDSSDENRGILELNAHNPLSPASWILGRLRWEARDIDGQHSDRYRVRLGAEREVTWAGRVAVPYVTAEAFYDTRYDQWNRQEYRLGAEIAIDDRWRIEPYFARRNDQRSEPAHVNAIGLAIKYFAAQRFEQLRQHLRRRCDDFAAIEEVRPALQVRHHPAGFLDEQRAGRHVPARQPHLPERVEPAGGDVGEVERRGARAAHAG